MSLLEINMHSDVILDDDYIANVVHMVRARPLVKFALR